MGDDPLHAGKGNFQAMLESTVHSAGKLLAIAIPFPSGPRQPGHSDEADKDSEKVTRERIQIFKSFMTDQSEGKN